MGSRQLRDGRHGRFRAMMAAATIAVAGLLGSGCALENLDPFSKPAQDIQTGSLNGIWDGTYICNQGPTRLQLTLSQGTDGRITGVFRFSADPSNPTVPTGAFTISGSLTGSSLVLQGDDWIDRPGTYEMVSLTAQLSSENPDQIQGTIDGAGCTTFTVRRA
jgi:hypothetical protein